MAMDLKRFQALKDRAEALQREADRAAGALQQLKFRLKDEFNCKTLEEAEKLLQRLSKEQKEAEKTFNQALKIFEAEFGDLLQEED